VEKIKDVVQLNADKGETGNKIVLWAFNFTCFRGAKVLPRHYNNEETRTKIVKSLMAAAPRMKLPPSKLLFNTIDVLPIGIKMNLSKMQYNDVQKIFNMKSNSFKLIEVALISNEWVDGKKGERVENKVDFFVHPRPYADNDPGFDWSLQVKFPMVRVEYSKDDGTKGFNTIDAPIQLVTKVANLFGEAQSRQVGERDRYYLDEEHTQNATKTSMTYFYRGKPTQPVPPCYTLEDKEGNAVAMWTLTTRCYNQNVVNFCNECRFNFDTLQEDEEHECVHTGNFVPSSRKRSERKKYRAKKVNLRDAAKGKRPRPTTDASPSKAPNKEPRLTSGAQNKNNLVQAGNNSNQEITDQELQHMIDAIPTALQSPPLTTTHESMDAPMDEEQEGEGEVDLFN
jgi:hypothetical protein